MFALMKFAANVGHTFLAEDESQKETEEKNSLDIEERENILQV